MGNGIAHVFALKGYSVTLVDLNRDALAGGLATITRNLDRQLKKGAISQDERDANAPVEVAFGREGSVFVNAYTGEVLGSGSTSTRAFFRSMMEWHRWLALKDASRATGKMITGVSNLLFFFIVISGFYLWWPRTWTWTQFRQVLWFRGGLRGKARDFNWHHVIGYWSLLPLAVIVWSGVVIGYPWASNLTFRMAGEEAPRPAPQAAARPGEAGGDRRLP